MAEDYAWRGKDTLQAIECFAQQGDVYAFWGMADSAIYIKEKASTLFKSIGKENRAYQTLGPTIRLLIRKGLLAKARQYCISYEGISGLFDDNNNIEHGREIYYSIKGDYYLAINQIDSAENMFRKELRYGQDLNNKIAGCRGLQKVFNIRKKPDSIAKYATLAYEFNDSAYSLSEMQNIQKFQASYNYNHHKLLAEQSEKKAQQSLNLLIVIIALVVIISILAYFRFRSYQAKRKAEILQYRKDLEK